MGGSIGRWSGRGWRLALALLVTAGVTAQSGATPSIVGAASGGDGDLTLTAQIEVAAADRGRDGVVYIAANVYGNWFFQDAAGAWRPWSGGALPAPAYSGGLGSHSLAVFGGVDLNLLPGVDIVAGYGLDAGDMLANGKFARIYRVAGTPQRTTASAPTAGAEFAIADGVAGTGFAFGGGDYLVSLEGDLATASVAATTLAGDGSSAGGAVTLGRAGESCCSNVAFDGSRYLVVWEEDQGIADSWEPLLAYGRFLTSAGGVAGDAFAITGTGVSLDGARFLAYGGGAYLMTYTRLIDPARGDEWDNRYVAARLIAPDGTVGGELRVSSGYGARSGVAFDGDRFLVVWTEDSADYEVRGRFVTPVGALGDEVSINASPAPSDNPVAVAFDGTRYLVLWNDEVGGAGSGEWNIYGQRLDPDGARVGDVIPVAVESGGQVIPTLAFDGVAYLAVWTDTANDIDGDGMCEEGESSCWDVHGQYLATDGTLLGERFTLSAAAGHQLGGVGAAGDGGSLVLVNHGVVFGEGGFARVEGVRGVLVSR